MFAQSWEDPACDLAALQPQPRDTILAITSGGDNVIGFLLTDPQQVIAVDVNPAQTYLLELKKAAFRRLTHADMLVLLGVRAGDRQARFDRVRDDLSPSARTFWDARRPWLTKGLLMQGAFERYYGMLRTALRMVIGRRRLERLFTLSLDEQRDFYEREWNTSGWRTLVRIGCSRHVLGRRLDPSWFAHADVPSFGAHFFRLGEHVIAELPARSNYFLAQLLLGRYLDEVTVPEYLKEEHFETIRNRLDRVTAVTADIGQALGELPSESIDCFALSNVFEYSPRELFDRSIATLVRTARPSARLSLRNLLAPRRLASHPAFVVDATLSKRLRDADRGFIYSSFEAARLAAVMPPFPCAARDSARG
jgi:S-adenosylmethionine-diacylglycerol 3-amino-3-carboxypropyl transferase